MNINLLVNLPYFAHYQNFPEMRNNAFREDYLQKKMKTGNVVDKKECALHDPNIKNLVFMSEYICV